MSSKKETYLNRVHYNVDKFYNDNHRVRKSGKPQALNIYQNNMGRLEGGRQHDPIYNGLYARVKTTNIYHYGSTLF